MRTKKFLSLLLSAAMAFSLLTATAFAAAPAEEENSFFDFLLGKKYTYLYAALTWDEYWANEKVYAAGSTAASAQLSSQYHHSLFSRHPALRHSEISRNDGDKLFGYS